ncbi:hypothetical protein [Moraxella bovis]|uniref:hypothetical protein n=1 Tax=Moraxella bovis TaxID=476 RepID=UPI00222694D8|nr:hypothetical protein [Moraxella bovis]UZA37383.1 hypothetical protein LP101_09400 [Moraxella bovis]
MEIIVMLGLFAFFAFAVIGTFRGISNNTGISHTNNQDTANAISIMQENHKNIISHFPYGELKSAWQDIIALESAYFVLVIFVFYMRLRFQDDTSKIQPTVDEIAEKWGQFILKLSKLPNNSQNLYYVKKGFQERQSVYIPLIQTYTNNIACNPASFNAIFKENYELYEKFIEFALENYEYIASNENSTMQFHKNPSDNHNFAQIYDSFYNETRFTAQNKHDYYQELRKNGESTNYDIKIDERVKFISEFALKISSDGRKFYSPYQ